MKKDSNSRQITTEETSDTQKTNSQPSGRCKSYLDNNYIKCKYINHSKNRLKKKTRLHLNYMLSTGKHTVDSKVNGR